MVLKNLKNILWNNLTLKVLSLLFGYAFWSMISQSLAVTVSIPVSLSFYNVPQNIAVEAPETIKVTLRGKRAHLNHLDCATLAFHIDGTALHSGDNYVSLKAEQLFLPETINLLDYNPSPLVIHINEKQSNIQEIQKTS